MHPCVIFHDCGSNTFCSIAVTRNPDGRSDGRQLLSCSLLSRNIAITLCFCVVISGLFLHTAVYHAVSETVYVFGGLEYQTDKTVPSSNLYSYDVKKAFWSLLPPEVGNRVRHLVDMCLCMENRFNFKSLIFFLEHNNYN